MNRLIERINYIKKLPQPEQKSKEWFELRHNMITASDIGTVIGVNPYETIFNFIQKKCGVISVNFNNKFVHHGKKYENIAALYYENLYNVKTDEYGLIQSDKYSFLGASPDRICSESTLDGNTSDMVGRMIEIKCPYKRAIKTSGEIYGVICPQYYWCQVQLQLEVCDLDECDFFQCDIKEYNNYHEWLEDLNNDVHYEEQNIDKNVNPLITRGCIIQLLPKSNHNIYEAKYIYPDTLNKTDDEYHNWIYENIINLQNDKLSNLYYFDRVLYWRIKKSHKVTITRDKEWFINNVNKMENVWKTVQYYRNNINELNKINFKIVDN